MHAVLTDVRKGKERRMTGYGNMNRMLHHIASSLTVRCRPESISVLPSLHGVVIDLGTNWGADAARTALSVVSLSHCRRQHTQRSTLQRPRANNLVVRLHNASRPTLSHFR